MFKFCKRVRFVSLSGDPKSPEETPFADDPVAWLSLLRRAGTSGLRLHQLARNHPLVSDRMSAAFAGGGGRWIVEARHGQQSDLWEAKWVVGDQRDPERKIWDVAYYRVDKDRAPLPIAVDDSLATLKSQLDDALTEIEAFAMRQQGLENFAEVFCDAKAALASDPSSAGSFHSDIAAGADFPMEAPQLLAAAEAAWVFGGMGSWNDIVLQGQDGVDYERVSEALFAAVNRAILGAVNASYVGAH